jgi:excisionase family DNA binding protein
MMKNKDILDSKRQFYSTTELASMLGVSRTAVFKKIRSGIIHAEKIGRNYIIPKEEIATALGVFVPERRRKEIDQSVDRTVREYGDALRRLGKE